MTHGHHHEHAASLESRVTQLEHQVAVLNHNFVHMKKSVKKAQKAQPVPAAPQQTNPAVLAKQKLWTIDAAHL